MTEAETIEAIAAWISRAGDGALAKSGTLAGNCKCLACLTTQTTCILFARMLRDGSWRNAATTESMAERKARSRRDTEPGEAT